MDTQYKQLIPALYLREGKAVKSLSDHSVTREDPASGAAEYDNGFTDAIMIFDLSDTDQEQEAHNDLIRKICGTTRVPVMAAGGIKRMEDVKKFLYAGCSMVFLNLSKKVNAELAAEVADKFGADRIGAAFRAEEELRENADLIRGNVSCLLYVGQEPFSGLSAVTKDALGCAEKDKEIPVIAQISESMCVRETLTPEGINGVTGAGVNKRIGKLQFVRNKEDRFAFSSQILHDLHQFFDLLRCKHGSRLVEDEDLVVTEEHLEDLCSLLHSYRDVFDLRVRIDLQSVFFGQRFYLCSGLIHLKDSALGFLDSEDDVLEYGKALNELEVLVYHSDAQVIGIVRVVDLYLLAVLFDHAFFSLVQAEQDGHEGGFTGTVFAKQGVYLALSQLQSDVVICYDAGKSFGDVHHFYGIRCVHNTVSLHM